MLGSANSWAMTGGSSRVAQISWVEHFLIRRAALFGKDGKTPIQKASWWGRDEGREAMVAFSSEGWLMLAGKEAAGDGGLRTGDSGSSTMPDACGMPCQSPGEGDRVVWKQSPGRDSTFPW